MGATTTAIGRAEAVPMAAILIADAAGCLPRFARAAGMRGRSRAIALTAQDVSYELRIYVR